MKLLNVSQWLYENTIALLVEYNSKQYRIICDSKNDLYLPQYIDSDIKVDDILDINEPWYDSYEKCVKLIVNDSKS
mgnify:CR=1 FL=1